MRSFSHMTPQAPPKKKMGEKLDTNQIDVKVRKFSDRGGTRTPIPRSRAVKLPNLE
jgi:hypothetical protein